MKNLYTHISNNSTNNPQNSWTNKITKKKTVLPKYFQPYNPLNCSIELVRRIISKRSKKFQQRVRSKNKKSATFRLVQINRPREIEFSTSRRDYLCGNPNRVEILKVGETALGITAAAIRLIALSQPRPFPLYSNMFMYENDAPQVDAPRSPLPCSSGLLVFPVRGISISLSPSLFFDLLCILVPLRILYFWPRQRYSTRAYVRYHGIITSGNHSDGEPLRNSRESKLLPANQISWDSRN